MTRRAIGFPLSALRGAVIAGALALPVAGYGQEANDDDTSYETCVDAFQLMQKYYSETNLRAQTQLQTIPVLCSGNPVCIGYYREGLYVWYARQYSLISDWYGEIVKCLRRARN